MVKVSHIFLALTSIATLCCCGERGRTLDDPFADDTVETSLKLSYTSNADTVFLSWEVLTDEKFDVFEVKVPEYDINRKLDRKAEGCTLTHIATYNSAVRCIITLLNGSETVDEINLNLSIDGLDKTMYAEIMPDHGSVCAGDGMYSVALPDGRSIFLIGDSFVCDVTNGSRPQGAHMYRNTYIVYNPKSHEVTPIYNFRGAGTNSSAAVPPDYPFEQKWYWPLDGFVMGNKLYVFQSLMYMQGEGMWGFAYERSNLLRYSLPGLELEKDEPIRFSSDKEIHYGAAAFNDGDYAYIYAQVDVTNDLDAITEVYCARAQEKDLYGSWEYYDGNGWSSDSGSAKALPGISSVSVSSQFNVFPLRDKYVLLTENKKLWVNEIYTFTSANPWGPWGNKKVIYTVPPFQDNNLMCYNAMAHPQFEKDGMILISYDMNTQDGNQQWKDVSTYRPRFFWADIDTILK
ncbi:MAG: DUF5005 domain-containing protein [Bacteroidales bacterium]|nr:DUF5005 domain-containing protein [Bacteroidales bacterium]